MTLIQTLNQNEFLSTYSFSPQEFKDTGLNWPDLEAICADHTASIQELEATAAYIAERLHQIPEAHSLKFRVKHPHHLIAKIIRKRLEKPDLQVTPENYHDHVTDLIGIRALHLFKDQWKPIHKFVMETWELAENPIAYVRKGDAEDVVSSFESSGMKVEEHKYGYRSVHYLVKSKPAKKVYLAELQVRTLFEEGWSEIDHQIRYPRISDDPRLAQFLVMFNRLAGSADEMGSFIKLLSSSLQQEAERFREVTEQLLKKEKDLKKAISDLNIKDSQKQALEKKVESLTKSSSPYAGIGVVGGTIDTLLGTATPWGKLTSFYSADNIGVIFPNRTCIRCGNKFSDDSPIIANKRCDKCRLLP